MPSRAVNGSSCARMLVSTAYRSPAFWAGPSFSVVQTLPNSVAKRAGLRLVDLLEDEEVVRQAEACDRRPESLGRGGGVPQRHGKGLDEVLRVPVYVPVGGPRQRELVRLVERQRGRPRRQRGRPRRQRAAVEELVRGMRLAVDRVLGGEPVIRGHALGPALQQARQRRGDMVGIGIPGRVDPVRDRGTIDEPQLEQREPRERGWDWRCLRHDHVLSNLTSHQVPATAPTPAIGAARASIRP